MTSQSDGQKTELKMETMEVGNPKWLLPNVEIQAEVGAEGFKTLLRLVEDSIRYPDKLGNRHARYCHAISLPPDTIAVFMGDYSLAIKVSEIRFIPNEVLNTASA